MEVPGAIPISMEMAAMIRFGARAEPHSNISGVAQAMMSSMVVMTPKSHISKETVVMTLFGHTAQMRSM